MFRRSHRRLVVASALAAALLLALAPSALGDALTPESGGSPNADSIDTLYKFVFVFGVLIFLAVEGLLIYTLVRYRFRRSNPEPAQIHGNTRLELGWTVAAALLLVVITVVTFAMLPGIRTPAPSGPAAGTSGLQFAATDQPEVPGGRAITINVVGQQFIWRYDYPRRGVFSYYEMVVPTNTTVVLKITSQDVQHAWWIPKLGGKMDAYPGMINETWMKVPRPGVYDGQCAELCGENHAQMYGRVRAVPPDQYEAFLDQRAAEIEEAQQELARSRRQLEQSQQGGGESTVEG
jgi:cytochrome c oxidase subunit II